MISRRGFLFSAGAVAAGPHPASERHLPLSGDDWWIHPLESGDDQARAFGALVPPPNAIPAVVPGDVHWDLERAGRIPPIHIGLNSRESWWVPGRKWCCRKTFRVPAAWRGKLVRLQFDGVDYLCEVWLNGQALGRHEGQFTPFEFDVSSRLKFARPNVVAALIHPAPESVRREMARWREPVKAGAQGGEWPVMQAMRKAYPRWKSMTNAGWDWGAMLITMGVWKDVRLLAGDGGYLSGLAVLPSVAAPYRRAVLQVRVESHFAADRNIELDLSVRPIGVEGAPVRSRQPVSGTGRHDLEIAVDRPRLWWPNGYGAQNLYELRVDAVAAGRRLDSLSTAFGIRDLRMLANPALPEHTEYVDYSTDRAVDKRLPVPPPDRRYLIRINGRRIFARGANWIPCDLLFGRPRRAAYERLIQLAAHANFNLLRVWGGGLIEKNEFYELCDRHGIMVYQEFPNAGARLPESDEAVAVTEREAREILPQVVNHPSIVRYGGGNEWYRTSHDSRQMARLREVCEEYDPTRPYHDPDPEVIAQRHGPHSFDHAQSYLTYNTGRPLSAGPAIPLEWTEYGAAGASSVATLRRIMPASSLWPVRRDDPHWVWHKAFRAFGEHNWLGLPQVVALFGDMPDLETLVRCSQFVQAEALRYANQSMRRRKWHLSGCAFWVYNEPWPNAAHGCIVEHYGAPKMAYWYVKQSYAPVDVSAVYDGLAWPSRIPVWVTNGTAHPLSSHTCRYAVYDLLGNPHFQGSARVECSAEVSCEAAEVAWNPPGELRGEVLLLQLELLDACGTVAARNLYTFAAGGEAPLLRPLLNAPRATLALHPAPGGLRIANAGPRPALFVKLERGDDSAPFADNYLFLLPGEERRIAMRAPGGRVEARAWNSAPVAVTL